MVVDKGLPVRGWLLELLAHQAHVGSRIGPMRLVARGVPYGAAADLARLDLDEQVPNSIRPGHRSGLPGRREEMVVCQRLGESKHQNAPARFVLFIDAVDLESDTRATDEIGQRTNGRSTEDHAAVAVLIGHGQDLRAIPGHETNPARRVLLQEFPAFGL
jgi:hypothetical protein